MSDQTLNDMTINATDLNESLSAELKSSNPLGGERPSYARLWASLGVASAVATVWLIIGLITAPSLAVGVIASTIFVFAFTSSVFFEDSATRNVMFFMGERSIRFPGLIWEFSFDGFMWLIGMKILFAVVGFIFGVICAIIGFIVAVIISPIALPFAINDFIKERR